MVSKFVIIHDLLEKNGKSIKENNLAKPRKFKIGDEVVFKIEITITQVGQDCDGSVLYGADYIGNGWGEENFEFAKKDSSHEKG